MKIQSFLICIVLILPNVALADDISDRIKTGMSKVEVSSVIGSEPDSEECTSVFGVSKCILVYKKGFISKTIYSITTVAGKVVSVTFQTRKTLGL